MTDLTEFLFPAPARRDAPSILRWWERRRLPYNLIVGSVGLVSLGVVNLLFHLPPHPVTGVFPWQPVVAFGVMANVCYSAGSVAEWVLERLGGGKLLPTGPTLFRMGLTFSVGLALLPSMIAGFAWVGRILQWIL